MAVMPERQYVQEDALYGLIHDAIAAGGVLAVQPNQDGSTGIKLVERVCPPEQNVFPCIGIAFDHYKADSAGTRTQEIVATFTIVVAVRMNYDHAVTDTKLAARLNLRNYVNDGNGNGLSALLRGNPTLIYNGAATCQKSRIADFQEALLTSEGQGAGVIATAFYQFETTDLVRY